MDKYLWPITLVVGAAVCALLLWYLFAPASYTNYPPREGPIVAFGDSLVSGTGSTEGHDFVSLVSKSINEPIINLGAPGDTTALGLARIDTATALHPRMAIVLLGGNDYLHKIPEADTFKNLRMVIERLQKDGALVVLLGVRGGLLSDHFAGDFKSLAKDTGSIYVSDVLDGLVGNRLYMFDQVHPNDAGYAVIADRVFKAIRPFLR